MEFDFLILIFSICFFQILSVKSFAINLCSRVMA